MHFGLFFFAAESERGAEPYALLREAARRVDGHLRFVSVPERHYHRFGGPYPAPALALAALSSITSELELRFGSLIAPLHEAVEIAEWYSMLCGLARGRIGVAFGSGWHRRDFLLRPDRYERRRAVLFEQIAEFEAILASGVTTSTGDLGLDRVEVHPRVPGGKAPRIWVTSSGNTDTFRDAGRRGFNVLTHLEMSGHEQLARNVEEYRRARQEAGHGASSGIVTLMMHTFVHDDARQVERAVAGLKDYLAIAMDLEASSAKLTGRMSGGRQATESELAGERNRREVIEVAVEKYLSGASLIGSRDTCRHAVRQVAACGVDEVACLIDYLQDDSLVLSGMPGLIDLSMAHSTQYLERERARMVADLMSGEDASS